MASSKIVRPHVHSLLHLASVKVAIPLCKYMDLKDAFKKGFESPYKGISQLDLEDLSEMISFEGRNYILSIPEHLRDAVLGAALCLYNAALLWKDNVSGIREMETDFRKFFWRSDGRMDGLKTASHLVLDTSIGIKERFYLACRYCLEDTIKKLWQEMVESGLTENLETSSDSMVRFWVKRLRNGSQACWRESIRKFFTDPNNSHEGARFSTFFPSLSQEERKRFLFSLKDEDVDDYLTCLYALTEKEEEEILKKIPLLVLFRFLTRPMRNFFLVTVDKMWKYIGEREFFLLLGYFFCSMRMDAFDFYKLFESFWKCSPENLRESARKIVGTSSLISNRRKKRKAEYGKIRNSKKIKLAEIDNLGSLIML